MPLKKEEELLVDAGREFLGPLYYRHTGGGAVFGRYTKPHIVLGGLGAYRWQSELDDTLTAIVLDWAASNPIRILKLAV